MNLVLAIVLILATVIYLVGVVYWYIWLAKTILRQKRQELSDALLVGNISAVLDVVWLIAPFIALLWPICRPREAIVTIKPDRRTHQAHD